MSKDTLFTNDSGAASGPLDYVRDSFTDSTLAATNNTSLTSTTSTNPLGFYFGNDDVPRLGQKTLYIKDLILVQDRTKWISNKPTYQVVWHEDFPAVKGYVFGNYTLLGKRDQPIVKIRMTGDGMGVTGVIRRLAFLVHPTTNAAATAQLRLDGANTTTIDISALSSTSEGAMTPKFSANVHAASNETYNLHDYQLTNTAVERLQLVGVIAYFENSGANIDIFPGITYVNKSKITTTTGATFAVPAAGSSLGANTLIYKTASSGYALSTISCSTVLSIAQGSSGTNLLTVSTGHGASFPIGAGIVVPQGTSMYVGSVLSVSTDTLTVAPTLSFGITNTIYRSWLAGSTIGINASLMKLAYSIDFKAQETFSPNYIDGQGNYNVWGANCGFTMLASTTDDIRSLVFGGASGFMQVDGYFSAAEVEVAGEAIFAATLSVNGVAGYSINQGQTGIVKYSVFSEAGPGWNSFVLAPGASLGVLGIQRVNLYQRNKDVGQTYGNLGSYDTHQAETERTALNATLIPLGLERRVYSDQLYMKGPWVRGTTYTAAGGVLYYGASTNAVMSVQYYGKDFAVVGTAGGGTLTLDGAGTALTFNAIKTVGSEGFHTVTYTVGSGGTAIIQAFDYFASKSPVKYEGSVNANTPIFPIRKSNRVSGKFYRAINTTLSDTTVTNIPYDSIDHDTRNAFDVNNFVYHVPEDGLYKISSTTTFLANATGLRLVLYLIDSITYNMAQIPGSAGGTAILNVTDDFELRKGSTVQVQAFQTSGGSLALAGGLDGLRFSIVKIGDL